MRPRTFIAIVVAIIAIGCLFLVAIILYAMMNWDSTMKNY